MNLAEQLNSIINYVRECTKGTNTLQEPLLRSKIIDFADLYYKLDVKTNTHSMEDIISHAVQFFGISREQFNSNQRKREFVDARTFSAMYIRQFIRENNKLIKITKIAATLNRHHATVIHMSRRHNSLLATCNLYLQNWNNFVKSLE